MNVSKFYKKLTSAEVGSTKTHEIYIRMSNDFDYETFFSGTHVQNQSVIEVNFSVDVQSRKNPSLPSSELELRFVYFVNSNKEKRIPGLGKLFKDYEVEEGDVVCLERNSTNGVPTYTLTFFGPNQVQVSPSCCTITQDITESNNIQSLEVTLFDSPLQQIFYGAPGTGKSHKIKEQLDGISKENIFRTTFHPDSDYASFVGTYKPTTEKKIDKVYTKNELISKLTEMKEGGVTYSTQKFGAKYWKSLKQLNLSDKKDILQACGMSDNYTVEFDKGTAVGEEYFARTNETQIIYSFVSQTFLNAYIQAYKKPEEKVYLIIEEINRGNCAQIFGDLFQLLDRDKNGVSEYSIKADADLRLFLEEQLGENNPGIKDGELCLPSNLYIFATMNTSDQSLFPIDSAFKRRWDWEYEPIKYKNKNWKIIVDGKEYSWVSFQRKVNDKILNATSSEDKMLGDYFVNPSDGKISEKVLLNKILFYLWNDVCKDGEGDIFKVSETEDITFSELYGENGTKILTKMMSYLEVEESEVNKVDDISDGNKVENKLE